MAAHSNTPVLPAISASDIIAASSRITSRSTYESACCSLSTPRTTNGYRAEDGDQHRGYPTHGDEQVSDAEYDYGCCHRSVCPAGAAVLSLGTRA